MPSKTLEDTVRILARLPGLGPRSARRVLLHLLERRDDLLNQTIAHLQAAQEKIRPCSVCGFLDETDPCGYCTDARRRGDQICVVQGHPDVQAIEKTRLYQGKYHVLGGVISALDGVRPENLRIAALIDRMKDTSIAEIILALPATVDGQTTASYIAGILTEQFPQLKVSRLAQGVPMGGELDYLDGATLAAAIKNRL